MNNKKQNTLTKRRISLLRKYIYLRRLWRNQKDWTISSSYYGFNVPEGKETMKKVFWTKSSSYYGNNVPITNSINIRKSLGLV